MFPIMSSTKPSIMLEIFLSKEEKYEMVEKAAPEDLARLEKDGKRTNNVLFSGIFTGASINITIAN